MKLVPKYLFLMFFFAFLTINGQNGKIDSLKLELEKHQKRDTIRVNILNSLAFSYFRKDIPKTLEYLDEAITIANQINFKKGKARNTYVRGITEVIQGNYAQSLNHYNDALKLYNDLGFEKGVADCYNAIGIAYRKKGELKKSTENLKKAIEIGERIKSPNLAATLINIGNTFEELGNYDNALLYLNKALLIARETDNEERIAFSLNNIGIVYRSQSNYPLALGHFKESLYMHEKLGDSISISNSLFNLGSIYQTQKDYNKAMDYFQKALALDKRLNRKKDVAMLLNSIGAIWNETGNYKNALAFYTNSLSISKEIGAKSDTPYVLNNIGEAYLKLNNYTLARQYFDDAKNESILIETNRALCGAYLGLAKTFMTQNLYNKALNNVSIAYEISKNSKYLDYQKEASEISFKIYQATGDYKKALENLKQFKRLNDSLFNKENIEKITALEYEYKYKQQLDSASIRELKLNKTIIDTSENLAKTQRNYLWAVIGALLLAILSGAIIFYQKYKNIKTKNQNIITEQRLLRSQMTPHFIFNSLAVLQGMILNKEEKKSVSYLSKFSKLLRIILENSRDKTVLLSQELEAVNNYLSLHTIENNACDYTLTVSDHIHTDTYKIPPMLIQPFIENAIEHAFPIAQDNMKININVRLDNDILQCTITDNGVGINSAFAKAENKSKSSLATTITEERLQILSKDFNVKGNLVVEDRSKYKEQGTKVTLTIPYKTVAA